MGFSEAVDEAFDDVFFEIGVHSGFNAVGAGAEAMFGVVAVNELAVLVHKALDRAPGNSRSMRRAATR
jgi:hypothetical protein